MDARKVLCSLIIMQTLIECVNVYGMNKDKYLRLRDDMIQKEYRMRTGGMIKLSDDELRVNATLMNLKAKELEAARRNVTNFPPAVHFFRAKALIDKSDVFKIIRNMPKGAVLHVHDVSILDVSWLIKNATYDPHCFMCTQSSGSLLFHFFDKPPSYDGTGCEWLQVNKVRAQAQDPSRFDDELYRQLTLIVDNPEEAYPTLSAVWTRFLSLFDAIFGLVLYAPVFKSYFYQGLEQFYYDGTQYMELRALFLPVYELDGSTHDSHWVMEAYINVTQQFVRDHPDFTGAKFIYSADRKGNKSSIAAAINDSMKLRKQFPSYFAGFDIVDVEDPGPPLLYFIDELLYPSQIGVDLPYFFHSGETDWMDQDVDKNLFDVVLLNTSRIGHGYAVTKHPVVKQLLQARHIPVEVCPISNQVLKLVSDLRNHPAAELMSSSFPMVIGCDDVAMWGAVGMSYDFYEAFMALGGAWADLATLKQLAINSIEYSSLSVADKEEAFALWQKKWKHFIQQTLEMSSLGNF